MYVHELFKPRGTDKIYTIFVIVGFVVACTMYMYMYNYMYTVYMYMYVSLSMYSKWYRLMAIKSSNYRLLYTDEHVHVYVYIYCIMIFLLLYTCTCS